VLGWIAVCNLAVVCLWQEEEADCSQLDANINEKRKSATVALEEADNQHTATEDKVKANTAPLQEKKAQEESLLGTQQAKVDDLAQQLAAATCGSLLGECVAMQT
jgi:septal ring factor EnvC (AmiA/AmiB activator)